MTESRIYKLAFSRIKGQSVKLAEQLIDAVGSEEDFFMMKTSELESIAGVKSVIYSDKHRADALEEAKREADYLDGHNVRAIYFSDAEYPQRLLTCEDAPVMIYVTGKCDLNAEHVVSIVGTRHATAYGIGFVNEVVKSLADQIDDLVIVSGLAYGIDIAAHRAALRESIRTVGVFAHGLSTIYPSTHRKDAAAMVGDGGAVLTEYIHDAPIHKGNFLARNRIVAGICDCLLVAESAEKGGALVTAKTAVGYGRDVFSLPGRKSDRYSIGCNNLIANNMATLVQSADDIIDAMRWNRRPQEGEQTFMALELNSEEQSVADYLREKGDARANEISIALNIALPKMLSMLIDLEFRGAIMSFPGGNYRLARTL